MRKALSIVGLCLFTGMSQAATYTVTNTNDSGPGSLRWAIGEANDHMGPDTIVFNIPFSDPGCDSTIGVCTIKPNSALPSLVDDSTIIDGTTQAKNQGDKNPYGPEIELNGLNADSADGLLIQASYNEVKGLTINSFLGNGIYIVMDSTHAAHHNRIVGCYIGTDSTGTGAHGNNWGIAISGGWSNVIGGPDTNLRNLISGNAGGIAVDGDSCIIINNYVGCDRTGSEPLGNGSTGISVAHSIGGSPHGNSRNNQVGGCGADSGNVVVANRGTGISLYWCDGWGNRVLGNWIGTNPDCDTGLGNNGAGIRIHWINDNYVGDTIPGAGNVIVGNSGGGIELWRAGNNVIRGNWIGTDPDTSLRLGNGEDGVLLAYGHWPMPTDSNLIERNFIWYNGRDGVRIVADTSAEDTFNRFNTITKNSITGNDSLGINLIGNANDGIQPPEIETVYFIENDSMVVKGKALPFARVEVFTDPAEEGKWPHCSTTANYLGKWTFETAHPPEPYVTATATDTFGNTSEFSDSVLGVEEEPPIVVDRGVLLEAHPTPFSITTAISYQLGAPGEVSLRIYDVCGKLVRTLVDARQEASYHTVLWNGKDDRGKEVSAGVYFCRFKAGSSKAIKKMILLR